MKTLAIILLLLFCAFTDGDNKYGRYWNQHQQTKSQSTLIKEYRKILIERDSLRFEISWRQRHIDQLWRILDRHKIDVSVKEYLITM